MGKEISKISSVGPYYEEVKSGDQKDLHKNMSIINYKSFAEGSKSAKQKLSYEFTSK